MTTNPVRKVLLNPGPATTSDTVKQALVISDVCPREPEFCALYADVRRRLAALAGDPEDVVAVPLVGCGTAGLEACLTSFVPDHGLAVILDNGDYGTRLAQIAAVHRLPHHVLDIGWGRPVDPQRVDNELAALPRRATHLVFVHHETSSGMLNPLEELLAVARRHRLRTLVDAMSSFAARPLRVGECGVDALVSSANKCVQGMAGLAFVIARRALFEESRGQAPRTLALDLVAEMDHLDRTGQSRFTVPPQVVSALHQALVELEQEGLACRAARYARSMKALRRGLAALGFEPLLGEALQSGILVAVREPAAPWYDFTRLHDELHAQGFTVYPGKTGRGTFRLAVLGDIDVPDIEAFLLALRRHVEQARARVAVAP